MSKKAYLFSISTHPDTIHINPLKITYFTPKINFSHYDYFILSSKQAVVALKAYPFEKYKDKKALCISTATAKSYENLGAQVLEIGSGYGDNLTSLISSYPKTTKWLYLRAEEVASDFAQKSREEGFSVEEVVVYKSECSDSMQSICICEEDQLIFTSPSSVKCFLKYHTIKQTNKVIVIGNTTAKALPKGLVPEVAYEKTVAACVKLLSL